MMNKNSVKGYAILGILFALVSVVVFAVPTAKTPAFWIAYGFNCGCICRATLYMEISPWAREISEKQIP